ncbi:MAG: cytochrome P450 [Acidimicrobiales bacterium]
MSITLGDIDLLEDTWARQVPHDQFDLLRAQAPVHWHEHPQWRGFWAVTRYDDVQAISRDHKTVSTELGTTFLQDMDEDALAMTRLTLLNMDPPKHSRYRRLVSAGFTPRMIGRLVEHIDEQAQGILDGLAGREEIEFVEEVAAELPLQVICEMIGVPHEDRHLIFDWSNRLVGMQDEDFRTSDEDGQMAAAEIYAYCDALIEDRRASPRDDIMSALVHAEVDGDRLRQDELDMFFVLLCVAGNETTRNLIAHSLQVLLEHPEVKADLAANIDDDELWTSATEEFLALGLGDPQLSAGRPRSTPRWPASRSRPAIVVIYYAAANRTRRTSPTRDNLQSALARPTITLTFGGGGAHFCLGANLRPSRDQDHGREFPPRFPDVEAAGPHRRMRWSTS